MKIENCAELRMEWFRGLGIDCGWKLPWPLSWTFQSFDLFDAFPIGLLYHTAQSH